MNYRIALILSLLAAPFAMADEMEISISDKSIDGSYEMFFGNNFSTQFSLLHSDMDNVQNADVYDEDTYNDKNGDDDKQDGVKTDMIGAGIYANSKITNIRTNLGGKVFYIDSDHGNYVYGLALGGGIDAYVRPNMFFTGEIHYAPDIITNGDFNDFWEVNTRASFQMLRNANVYLGYKLVTANFERIDRDSTENREFFSGPYLGFRFSL